MHVLYAYMWRPEVGLRGLPPLLSNFLSEVGSLSCTQSSDWPAYSWDQLSSHLACWNYRLAATVIWHSCAFWVSELRSSNLQREYLVI